MYIWGKYSDDLGIVPSLCTFVLKQDILTSQSTQSLCDHDCVLNSLAGIASCYAFLFRVIAQTGRAFAKLGFCFLQKAKTKFCLLLPFFLTGRASEITRSVQHEQ